MQTNLFANIVAISTGAASGALLRWQLGLHLPKLMGSIPLGTLAANWVGGLIIGLALGLMSHIPGLPPHWRLLIVTGFCGGLTTFSTFSAEIIEQLQHGRLGMAGLAIALHLGGSLLLTFIGMIVGSSLRFS